MSSWSRKPTQFNGSNINDNSGRCELMSRHAHQRVPRTVLIAISQQRQAHAQAGRAQFHVDGPREGARTPNTVCMRDERAGLRVKFTCARAVCVHAGSSDGDVAHDTTLTEPALRGGMPLPRRSSRTAQTQPSLPTGSIPTRAWQPVWRGVTKLRLTDGSRRSSSRLILGPCEPPAAPTVPQSHQPLGRTVS